MRNTLAVPVLAVLAFAVLSAGCAAGGGQPTEAPTPSPNVPTPRPVQPTPGATGGGGTEVSIANFAYNPATIQVQAGDPVTWTNDDSAPHTVTFADGPDSGNLNPGATFEHAFEAGGEYEYVCQIHPAMRGKVSVSP